LNNHFFAFASAIPLNDWIEAVVVTVISFIIIHSLVAWLRKRLHRVNNDHRSATAALLEDTLAETSYTATVAFCLLLGMSMLALPASWDLRIHQLWVIVIGLQLALYLNRVVVIVARRHFRADTETLQGATTIAHSLIVWTLQAILWIVFLLAAMDNVGINVSTFVASLGIGGIAIALAAQNVLGDLFASLAIAIDKPFEVGDAIGTANFSGGVERVGLKTTRLRADSGEQIIIANSDLLKNTIRNYKRLNTRRIQLNLKVRLDTSVELGAKLPAIFRQLIEKHEQVRFDRAHLTTLDQNGLGYEIVFYVQSADYGLYMDTQQAVLLDTMRAFAELGVAVTPMPGLAAAAGAHS
jgi:small-conductance mechanosensitive channel